jgi:DtxR family Mn-dependent transcriptional regulator
MLSQAVEDYLKTIYKLQARGEEIPVSTGQIAEAMDISAASVSNMIKRLTEMELVEYESYKGVTLTETGIKIALEVIRHHRLLELYLREIMDYPWDKLHEEAEHLEHHISEDFEEKLEELLDNPTHDPHGDPIPTRRGTIAETATRPLASVEPGEQVVIRRVSDTDPDLLTYLEEINLLPRNEVAVVEKSAFNGPLTVRTNGNEHIVGYEVACKVFVE